MTKLVTGVIPEFGLGDRLEKARKIRGLEQRELAQMLGIHRQSVARYERGDAIPKRAVLMAWAFMTGVDLFWLRGEDNPEADDDGLVMPDFQLLGAMGGQRDVKYTPRDLNPEPTDYRFAWTLAA